MAKGLKEHQLHQQKVAALGKELARRSGRKCEICTESGVSLSIVEIIDSEPSIDSCLMICEVCESQIKQPKNRDINHLRCLNHSVWSDVEVVQACAFWLLNQLNTDWGQELKEQVFLSDDAKALLGLIEKNFQTKRK